MSNMVVQTNILALNTHRNMKAVGGAQAKASNRLASGYRINSAADDAAGLAISEKMKAQIRGLKQAQNNTEDGINLCKTEDGGMDGIQEMLIRIRELVIQGLNDTNTDEDRDKIQLEINQLIAEMGETADRVEFNNIKLLNQSSLDLELRMPIVPAVKTEYPGLLLPNTPPIPVPYSMDWQTTVIDTQGNVRGIVDFAEEYAIPWEEGDKVEFDLNYNLHIPKTRESGITPPLNEPVPTSIPYIPADNPIPDETWGLPPGPPYLPPITYSYPSSNGTYGWYASQTDARYIYPDITITAPNGEYWEWHGSDLSGVFANTLPPGFEILINDNNDLTPPNIDREKGIYGSDILTISVRATFENCGDNHDAINNEDCNDLVCAATMGNYCTINFPDDWTINITNNNTGYRHNEIETVEYTRERYKATFNADGTFRGWVDATPLGYLPDKFTYDHTFQFHNSTVSEVNSTLDITKQIKGDPPLHIQCGANANQGTFVDRYDCRPQVLGLLDGWGYNNIFTYPNERGTASLVLIDEVFGKINAYRARAGAQQNRLEFTDNSLGVAFTNLEDANSRIANADIAKEMMNLTKSNVLQQAAVAMLAQANQNPESLLQLLR